MSDATPPLSKDLTSLRLLADGLKARLRILKNAASISIGELEAMAAHERQAKNRREGRLSIAQLKHAHGARAEIHGYLDLDDYAVLGLEHHGVLHALWLARAALENPAGTYGDLLRIILDDPSRAAWCRAEGARVSWEYAKAARDDETASFIKRLNEGRLGNWQSKSMSERQHYLITLICVRADIAYPHGLKRRAAYDWIQRRGSHPDFWSPPPPAPQWPSTTRT